MVILLSSYFVHSPSAEVVENNRNDYHVSAVFGFVYIFALRIGNICPRVPPAVVSNRF